MANSEQSAAKSTWISESILIASAPAAAYLLSYSYIAGYADYFHIPTEFISLNIATMFSIARPILVLLLMVYTLFIMLFLFWPLTDNPIRTRTVRIFPFAALTLLQLLFFGKHWYEWIGSFSVLAYLAAQFFLVPLIGRSRVPSYTEKLREYDRRESARPPTVTDHFIGSSLGQRVLTVAFWTWFS